jgi:hypothetical protein
MTAIWTIGPGCIDSAQFFRVLPAHFPDATSLYAEGTTIQPDVKALLVSFAEEGAFLPGAQTIWPESLKVRCRFGAELCRALADAAERHAEPELLDHLFLYAGDSALLQWPDAFSQEMYLPSSLAEDRVSQFAGSLGLSYAIRNAG